MIDMSYSVDVGYIEKMPWTDGTEIYCRKCDAKVAHVSRGPWLVCTAGHGQHAANALVSGQISQ